MKALIILFCLLLTASGCTSKAVETTTPAPPEPLTTAAAPQTTTAAATTAPAGVEPAPRQGMIVGPYSPEDLAAGPVKHGSTLAQTLEALGEPDERRKTENIKGDPQTVLRYGGTELTFTGSDPVLSEFQADCRTLPGPRGIAVGNTLDEITRAFCLSGEGDPYYAAEGDMPPMAEKLYLEGDSTYLILLTAPLAPYPERVLHMGKAYEEELHGQLVYTLCATTHVIESIHCIVGPLGENGG